MEARVLVSDCVNSSVYCPINLPSHVSETKPCPKSKSGDGQFHHHEHMKGSSYGNSLCQDYMVEIHAVLLF